MEPTKTIVPEKHMSAFVDLLQKQHGVTHDGRDDINASDGERREAGHKVAGLLTAFMRRPFAALSAAEGKLREMTAHASTTMGDIPQLLSDMASVFRIVRNYDQAWESAFVDAIVDQGKNWWEIADMNEGIQFRKVPEGGRLVVEGISGSYAIARVDAYGAAVGWSDQAIRFRMINLINQQAMALQDSWFQDRADRHYLLLASAIGAATTSWTATSVATTDPLYEVTRDLKTIQAGAFALADRLKDQHVGNPLGQEMLLYANPVMWSRLTAALRRTTQDIQGAPNAVPYNIRLVLTFNNYLTSTSGTSTNTNALLVLPGYKNQKAMVMAPTSSFRFDHLTNGYTQAVWSYYGAAVEASATQTQVQRLSFA